MKKEGEITSISKITSCFASYYFLFFRLGILFFLFLYSCDWDTRSIPGDKSAFDPIAALPGVQKYAGEGAILETIYAVHIKPDGTLDLKADYNPYVTYGFMREDKIKVSEKEKEGPIGTTKKKENLAENQWKSVSIEIRKPHWEIKQQRQVSDVSESGHSYLYSRGMFKMVRNWASPKPDFINRSKSGQEIIPFGQIWANAIKAGAPSTGAVANIRYSPYSKYAFSYHFIIPNTNYNYKFDEKGVLVEKQ